MLNRIRLTSFSSHSFSLKFLNKALSSLKISKRFSDAEKNRLPDFKITSFSNSRSKFSKFLEIEFLMVLIKSVSNSRKFKVELSSSKKTLLYLLQ